MLGNDLATFPDYPEIRAPQGTVGVSGFQIHIGRILTLTPWRYYADVFCSVNQTAKSQNKNWIKKGGTIIVNIDSFTKKDFAKLDTNILH